MSWFPDLVREVGALEFGSVAGVANILGLIAVIRLAPTVSFAERAMRAALLFIEGRRKFLAAKEGFHYEPHVKGFPKPEKFARRKNFIYIAGFLLLCVSVLKVLVD